MCVHVSSFMGDKLLLHFDTILIIASIYNLHMWNYKIAIATHDCKCNLSPMKLKGNQIVYTLNSKKKNWPNVC